MMNHARHIFSQDQSYPAPRAASAKICTIHSETATTSSTRRIVFLVAASGKSLRSVSAFTTFIIAQFTPGYAKPYKRLHTAGAVQRLT